MLTKKLCKDSARSVQDKTKVCFCFYCRAAAYLSLLMFRIQPALVKSKTSVDNYKHSQYITLSLKRKGVASMYQFVPWHKLGAPDKPCGVGRADANPKLLLNDT